MIQQQNARYSGEVLLSSEKSGMVNQKCIFCEGKHWSHENWKYSSLSTRKSWLKSRRFISLKNGHQNGHFLVNMNN